MTPTPAGVVALGLLALACTGVVETGEGDGGSKGGSGNNPGGGGAGSAPLTEDPGRKEMHRLNSAEYNNTVADMLGTALQPANASWRGGELDGFDNIAAVLGVDDAQYERYYTAAEQIAEDVFANPALKGQIVTCATPDDATCVQGIIHAVGLKLFRRPLSPEEVGTYNTVYTAARTLGDDHDASLKLVVRAMLASAEFLYRIEIDPDPTTNTPHPVTAYELASRISYFLWSSAPDSALLAAAADGSISSDAGLTGAVDRMLADPKGQRFIENFAGQWLGARQVKDHPVDAGIYGAWTAEVAASATREIHAYFGEFLNGDRNWLEFLKADVNFVDGALAPLYDMPAPAAGMSRVEVTTDNRFGFFGLAGFLANSSMTKRTSPTLRGRWILINLLCNHPEPPPPEVPELEESSPQAEQLNIRDVLAKHREDPRCAGCHDHLDPYGLALEEFDGIGRFRSAYPDGSGIDPATTLPPSSSYPDGITFTGLTGLADAVTQNPEFNKCVGNRLFTYGLGRVVNDSDKPYLEAIQQEWLAGGNPTLRSLIHALVLADTFRLRRGL